jgi:hypothetical protein
MASRFSGTIEELKAKLVSLESDGSWAQINLNQCQFRHIDGCVMNWFPSTGSINFQGKPAGRDSLQTKIVNLLQASAAPTSTGTIERVEPQVEKQIAPEAKLQTDQKKSQESLISSCDSLRAFSDSELIIGLVGAVGTEMDEIINVLTDRLKIVGHTAHKIHVSKQVIPNLVNVDVVGLEEGRRIATLMDAGDEVRKRSGDSGVLAAGIAAEIAALRVPGSKVLTRTAFIINSLKHPDEVLRLRQIYPRGFHLIGVHPDENVRLSFLKRKGVSDEDSTHLMERDQDEHLPFGQRVNDTFHMSDFFVRLDNDRLKLEKSILRIFDILFGDPYKTPTFDEFAMFLAFTASLRRPTSLDR